jgi:hypothetical protein
MTTGPGKGNIQLADLIRALSRLDWQDGHATDIAACLGFDISQIPDKKPVHEISDPRLKKNPVNQSIENRSSRSPVTPPQPDLPPSKPAIKSDNQTLTERTQSAQSAHLDEEWSEPSNALLTEPTLKKFARINLFPDRVSRHLFSTALGTHRAGRDIDIQRLINSICREPIILELPRTLETTLETGCHLLRDFSQNMAPWHEDLISLEQQVQDVIGTTRLHTYNFDGILEKPLRWTSEGEPDYWQPDGRPVLVASDLAMQGATKNFKLDEKWHAFIDTCRQYASPLVILTPWPDSFTPRDLGNYARLVHWSPRTTVAMIKRHRTGNL